MKVIMRRKIKKPSFILTYCGCLVIVAAFLACIGKLIYNNISWEYYRDATTWTDWHVQRVENAIFTGLNKKDVTAQDIAHIKTAVLNNYTATGQRYRVYYNKQEVADTSWSMIMHYSPVSDTEPEAYRICYFELADAKYMKYFETPEVLQYKAVVPAFSYDDASVIVARFDEKPTIELAVTEAYIDIENAKFIPVSCHICNTKEVGMNGISNVVVNIPIDKDSPELKGYTHIVWNGSDYFSASIEGFQGTENEAEYNGSSFALNDYNVYFGDECTELTYMPFAEAYKNQITILYSVLAALAVVLSFIPAAIIYNHKKRNYEIFEYRRKVTDAMAHDLKTPMAAILTYAENLENHTGENKQEFYVSKISEKVWQMNKMVNSMLDFSRGENESVTVNKTAVDIGAVLADAIAENEHEITKRGLSVSYEKAEVMVNTDKELFSQAIGNLINNAALYAKEGSTVSITCDSSKVCVINVVAEKIEDAEAMKQPFAKGAKSRRNMGTGLGLAIAENNLVLLGCKLDVKSEGDKFVVTVTL